MLQELYLCLIQATGYLEKRTAKLTVSAICNNHICKLSMFMQTSKVSVY